MLDDFDDAELGSSDADASEKILILIIHRENEADHADFSFLQFRSRNDRKPRSGDMYPSIHDKWL